MAQEQQGNCFLRLEPVKGARLRNAALGSIIENTLHFTNMPGDLGTGKSANLAQTSILGRSEPIKTYGSSGPRAWNLELQFFADDDVEKDVDRKVSWCESLVYPIYTVMGVSLGLPPLTFVFGDYLNVRCVCSNVQTGLPGPWGLSFGNQQADPASAFRVGLPLYATCTLTLEHTPIEPFDQDQVMRGNHNRG